jgi:hypothetical protein
LNTALAKRGPDVRALFINENGILPHLCEMLSNFISPPESESDDEYIEEEFELSENVHAAALRFLNECRRLTAMWL